MYPYFVLSTTLPPGTASHEAVDSFTDESPGHLGVLLEALTSCRR